MSLPDPHPGLVISYAYLWADEARQGHEDGRKNRPAAIVLVRQTYLNTQIVTVLPITHTQPTNPADAIAIPTTVQRIVGLDDTEPSWIVLTEVNDFVWPGPDMNAVPGSDPPRFHYGVLPPGFFRMVRDRLLATVQARRTARVTRTE